MSSKESILLLGPHQTATKLGQNWEWWIIIPKLGSKPSMWSSGMRLFLQLIINTYNFPSARLWRCIRCLFKLVTSDHAFWTFTWADMLPAVDSMCQECAVWHESYVLYCSLHSLSGLCWLLLKFSNPAVTEFHLLTFAYACSYYCFEASS